MRGGDHRCVRLAGGRPVESLIIMILIRDHKRDGLLDEGEFKLCMNDYFRNYILIEEH